MSHPTNPCIHPSYPSLRRTLPPSLTYTWLNLFHSYGLYVSHLLNCGVFPLEAIQLLVLFCQRLFHDLKAMFHLLDIHLERKVEDVIKILDSKGCFKVQTPKQGIRLAQWYKIHWTPCRHALPEGLKFLGNFGFRLSVSQLKRMNCRWCCTICLWYA